MTIVRERRFYPTHTRDRFVFWSIPVSAFLAYLEFSERAYVMGTLNAFAFLFGVTILWVVPIEWDDEDEFSQAIAAAKSVEEQLGKLATFLELERERAIAAEREVQRLQSEKGELEPIVQSHRSTIDAILSAHSRRAARSIWKERAIGFLLGVMASLVAASIGRQIWP